MNDAAHPTQTLRYPGIEADMDEQPHDRMRDYRGSGLLTGKVALVTGGDSGIGRAVAVGFAKEGADVAIAYLSEEEDADLTCDLIRQAGQACVKVAGDLADKEHRRWTVSCAVKEFGRIDILVNNAGFQAPVGAVEELSVDQWRRTFAVNAEASFFLTQLALDHMPRGGCVINTASVTGLRGSAELIDYAASKGAIIALTQSLSQALMDRGIRVNAVAPGPVWTPLIPATFGVEKIKSFGTDVPMGRAAQPDEIAPTFIFLAAERFSSYYSGEVLSPLGGVTMPG